MTPDVSGKRVLTIKHTRQQGTLVYGTRPGDGSGNVLRPHGFRGSDWLPVDEELGHPYWYDPHSRRSRADAWKIEQVNAALEAVGFGVNVIVDNTTPATGFDDLEGERYQRADVRADRYDDRADRAEMTSDGIRAANQRTYDALNGTPILIGHYSEGRHRRLLDRLWRREGKAWELYDLAREWRARADTAGRYQHRREAVGTTLRRIERLEARLRQIDRDMDGRVEVLWDDPEGSSGSAAKQVEALEARGIPVEVLGLEGQHVRIHIWLSSQYKAELAAEVVELAEEISYWEGVIEASGVKVWGRVDFVKGDFVSAGGPRWYEVVSVGAKSVSVPDLYSSHGPAVHTMAASGRRSRHAPATQTLPYDKVKGRLSAEEARERFPEAFAEPAEADGPPARPSKKRGSVKLEHSPGAMWENWYFEVERQRYRAVWRHPEGWFSGGSVLQPCVGDLPRVRIFKSAVQLGKADQATGIEIPVEGSVWYVEEIHNLVRELVERLAKEGVTS